MDFQFDPYLELHSAELVDSSDFMANILQHIIQHFSSVNIASELARNLIFHYEQISNSDTWLSEESFDMSRESWIRHTFGKTVSERGRGHD